MTRKIPYLPVLILVAINLLLAPLFIDDYGENWDDNSQYLYAENTLDAYWRGLNNEPLVKKNLEPFNRRFYGPVHTVTAGLGNRAFQAIPNDWTIVDRWHLASFVEFQVALILLFALSRRVVNDWAAFGAVLLFQFQPLIFGHAIISQKDIPFMTFFMASILFGLLMVDQFNEVHARRLKEKGEFQIRLRSLMSKAVSDWEESVPRTKCIALSLISVMLLLGVILFVAQVSIATWVTQAVESVYFAGEETLLGRLFQSLAVNSGQVPVESYVSKAIAFLPGLRLAFVVVALVGIAGILLYTLPETRLWLWNRGVLPVWQILRAYVPWRVVLAGVVLGLCTSVRILGPAAGGLVAIYFLTKSGWKSLPALFVYSTIALGVTIITWPYLWEAPIRRLWEVLLLMSEYPGVGSVLFAGEYISPVDIPHRYVVTLMGIQLTIPALILFVTGFVLAVRLFSQNKIDRALFFLLAAWLFVPVIVFSINPPPLSDNVRHLTFLFPPIFVFCGFALHQLWNWLSSKRQWVLIVALLVLPGLFWIVRLHPYQYVFYNGFVGWVNGAYTNYHMDYYVTSFREAANYLNENAPEGSQVIVFGPEHIVKRMTRSDVRFAQELIYSEEELALDFAIMTTRNNWHLENYPDAPIVYEIGREGAVYAVVKDVSGEEYIP